MPQVLAALGGRLKKPFASAASDVESMYTDVEMKLEQ
jgi:hypothetical protein